LLTLCGCRLFEPRKAEEPQGVIVWNHFPITPYQTFENLQTVYDYKEGAERYRSILTSDFSFNFDSQDTQDYHLPVSWDKDSEVEMRGLINSEMELIMTNIPEKKDRVQAESAVLYRNYRLRFISGRSNNVFEGNMALYLRREADGFWRIERWDDFRSNDHVTWGRLKYEYVPQKA
jgi:hypothetical protein